uniref:ANK_REP_REGION domain-containing protein n=1 Tax=Globodera rostochiensis TaxID=31243 RepID=A0A914HAA8_GLORO
MMYQYSTARQGLVKSELMAVPLSLGFSPLYLAAREGHLEVCKLLIAKGADTNQKTNNGVSPWLIACGKGRADIVQLFLANGQDIEATGRISHTRH